jgi:hypothetical protein
MCSEPAGAAAVTAIASTPSRIEKLELGLNSPSVDHCRMIARMPHLRDLSLTLNEDVTAEHFEAMAAEKPKWTRLKLNTGEDEWEGVEVLLNSLTCLEEWRCADFSFVSHLKKVALPALRTLSLDLSSFKQPDVGRWVDFICAQPRIEKVVFARGSAGVVNDLRKRVQQRKSSVEVVTAVTDPWE